MTRVKGITKYITVLMLVSALLAINSFQAGFSQPPTGIQPQIAESLSYIAQLLVKQTVIKFDTVLYQNRFVTGKLLTPELVFRLDAGGGRLLKTSEIAALIFETGKVQIVLQSGERLLGQLLTDVEIALVGHEDLRMTLAHDVMHIGAGIVVLSGQLQSLTNVELQGLLARFLNLITFSDMMVFQNDGIVAGKVTNQVFQIDEFYFNKEDIAEIIFGTPSQLRERSGRVRIGTIRTPTVTIEFSPTSFTFPTQALARILFTDRTVTFSRAAALAERLLPGDPTEGQNPRGRP